MLALVKPLNTSTSCDCDTQSVATLEALVSSTIESFFVDLEAESSSGVYEMHDLFIASDVAVAKISPTGLHKKMIDDALTPCTIMLVNRLQDQPFRRPLRVLMDSGSRCSVIKWSSLPIGTKTSEVSRAIVSLTSSGQITEEVALEDMVLAEFSRTLRINDRFRCYVLENNDIPYDVILDATF